MLDAFLSRHEAEGEEHVTWSTDLGAVPLHIRYFLTGEAPPQELVTSVRGVVLRGASVLVLRNHDAVHALPGGRRERGETFVETLRREVLEESGYRVEAARPLGFVHLRHLGPRPAGYAYLYPDFLWAVFVADASVAERLHVQDDYEVEATFLLSADALARIDYGSRIFVRAAVDG